MKIMKTKVLFLLSLLILSGCSKMKIEDFKNTTPEFPLEEYFDGNLEAWGIFEDRFGNLRRQFRVEINGYIKDEKLILEEDFYYSDGERDRRVWTIVNKENGVYEGKADDIVGTAIGHSEGNAFNWSYKFDLNVSGRNYRVKFDDWLFRLDERIVINKARVSKFGLTIGTVTLFFEKK